jgi:hypothetical protein
MMGTWNDIQLLDGPLLVGGLLGFGLYGAILKAVKTIQKSHP